MRFGEVSVLLTSETFISTQTAIVTPPDQVIGGNPFGMTTRDPEEL